MHMPLALVPVLHFQTNGFESIASNRVFLSWPRVLDRPGGGLRTSRTYLKHILSLQVFQSALKLAISLVRVRGINVFSYTCSAHAGLIGLNPRLLLPD